MRLNSNGSAVVDSNAPINSREGGSASVQVPVYSPGDDPLIGSGEPKPFPWMWVGIGAGALLVVWYFFLRKK